MKNSSIFKSAAGRTAVLAWYNTIVSSLPIQTEARQVPTSFGETHLTIAGHTNLPPLIVLHGMNMNGPAMAQAIIPLSKTHRVYAIDIIGCRAKVPVPAPPEPEMTMPAGW